ncbi:YbaB/EbfC family DNA-binding protein [Modestobacter versicolor]|nr:YbaB/EbfC family nucleoid-associated protein [Modestobacter versicolor]PZA19459.1 YbaB/EbfC family DNA-binding protein [Modestobacter versicolor]
MALAESLRSTAEKLATEGPRLQAEAKAVQVTETSRDGLVTVTVGSRGELVRLDIDPRVFRRPDSRELADTITETVHRAAAAAQERVLDVLEPLVPRRTMQAHLDGDTEAVVSGMTDQMFGRS